MSIEITLGTEATHAVEVARHGTRATVTIDGRDHRASLRPAGDASELTFETRTERIWTVVDADTVWVHAFGRAWELSLVDPVERALAGGASEDTSVAPMPGTVITVAVDVGQQVVAGEQLVVIESMKMQSEIVAPRDGVVEKVFVAVGSTFDRGASLVSLQARDAGDGVQGLMRRLETHVDKTSPTYRIYREHNLALAAELRETLHRARYERPPQAVERLAEQDKLMVRERLDLLLDRGAPFLELMSLAANRHYDGEAPQALLVTGIGVVSGREVMVIANDSSLKGGAWYPITTRKIVRALEIALENRLPVIHMLDSGGANLHLQDEIYAWAGHIFKQQCQLSAAGVPQLAVVFGYCTAGAAYTPTLCDQTIMVRERGAIFLAGPPLVKAATGEVVSTEDLGGADMHTGISGVADYAVDTEAEALSLAREVVGVWARREKSDSDRRDPEPPFHDPDDLYGIIPDDVKKQFEMREVIARIVDGSMFHEFKPRYGDTMVTGWAFIWGMKVGILANNGVIYSEAANKATTFMQLCDRDGIPLLFLHNVTGFMVGREYERRGITKDGAKMLMVQANVTVPKLTVLCHASQGAGNYAMAGRTWDPRLLFAWPNSRSSIMGPEVAADTLTHVRVTALKRQGKDPSPEETARIRADVTAHFEETYHSYYLTSDLRDDGLIDPTDTRNALGMSLSAVLNAPIVRAPGGVLESSKTRHPGGPMEEAVVTYECQDNVAWLTINRPQARNALSQAVRDGLWDGFRRFAADDGAAVLILTGAGEKAFCAGGDLKEMSDTALRIPPPDFLPYLQRTVKTDKPVIAAVNGVAFAGGFLLAQMCDLVIAADHARFAITEVKVGRGSPWAAPLPWLVGPRAAMEIMVTGDPITAQRAYEIGLVNRVVPAQALREAALEMASSIAVNAPLSVRAAKELVYLSAEHGWRAALDFADKLYEPVYLSEDGQEGPRAFKEKRKPHWQAR